MWKTNKCPKCESTQIVGPFDRSIDAQAWYSKWKNFVPECYICQKCGHTEEYVKLKDFKRLENL